MDFGADVLIGGRHWKLRLECLRVGRLSELREIWSTQWAAKDADNSQYRAG